jgi:putative ubiquitin-RnfH superfamily antitoxin RatB of RatAB toxin-antitoxin module
MGPADLADRAAVLSVEVAYSPSPGVVDVQALTVAPPCSALQVLRASGLLQRHGLSEAALLGEAATLSVAVWGKVKPPDVPLRDRDRVELLRSLRVDPKEARRQRYKTQGAGRKRPAPPGDRGTGTPASPTVSDTPTR